MLRVQALPRNAMVEVEATAATTEGYKFSWYKGDDESFKAHKFKEDAKLIKIDVYSHADYVKPQFDSVPSCTVISGINVLACYDANGTETNCIITIEEFSC